VQEPQAEDVPIEPQRAPHVLRVVVHVPDADDHSRHTREWSSLRREKAFDLSDPKPLCRESVSAATMPTEVLYMEERRGQEPDPCYLREFDATITELGPDFVILDRTAFYAEGGGQPYDTGLFSWPGGQA